MSENRTESPYDAHQFGIGVVRRLLTDHFNHAKNVYGNLLHPTELNDLTDMVNTAHGHLNDAEVSMNRMGTEVHKHMSRAADVIHGISQAWQSRSPQLPTEGPHWFEGDRQQPLWSRVSETADEVSRDMQRMKLGFEPEHT